MLIKGSHGCRDTWHEFQMQSSRNVNSKCVTNSNTETAFARIKVDSVRLRSANFYEASKHEILCSVCVAFSFPE